MIVYVVKSEYEMGSENGENNEILGVYDSEEKAKAVVEDWYKDDCPRREGKPHEIEEDEDSDEAGAWCIHCLWNADYDAHEVL